MRITNQLLICFGLIVALGCAASKPAKVTPLPPLPQLATVKLTPDSPQTAAILVAPAGRVYTLVWTPNPNATATIIVDSPTLTVPRDSWPVYARILNAVTNTCQFTNNGTACFFAARSE
jgi:hypothetical protein